MTLQGLKLIQREEWESEKKPGYRCFKLNLDRLSFSLLLIEGDWGDSIFLGFG